MTDKPSDYLNWAVEKGMIQAQEAAYLKKTIDSVGDPLKWLYENKHLTEDQIEDLQKGALALLRENDLSGKESTSEAVPTSGEYFGPYELVKKLGTGGMGVVYSAHDSRLDRTVAIKLLHRAENPTILARFQREAKVMARLKHPRIVNIFDVGEERDRPYLVMEMYEGISLEQALQKKTLSRKKIVEVIRQAAVGISFANKNGVIHRDVKPANIIVTPKGEGIVMDFGLAKLAEGQEQTLSVEGSVLGTPAYMSPEQATGNLEKVDRRTDVWGLGATLYHGLVGEPPFSGKSVHGILKRIIENEPDSLRKKDPSIHSDLETICFTALEKNPKDRYPTATEFAKDLRLYLSGEPISATAPGKGKVILKWGSKNRKGLYGLTGALVLAITTTVLFSGITKSDRFERLKGETTVAFGKEQWTKVIASGEEALRIQKDPNLETLLTKARNELEREKEQKIHKATLEHLREKIAPLEESIRETRVLIYAKGVDLGSKLSSVEILILELESLLAKDVLYQKLALGWKRIGVGWYFVGDPVRAENALLAANTLAPNDREVTEHLGKIYLQRSLETLRAKEFLSKAKRRDLAEEWAEKATQLLEKTKSNSKKFESLLNQAYLALAKGDRGTLDQICRFALSTYKETLGVEEFLFLQASVDSSAESIPKLTEVIERAPNHSRAYYIRGMLRARKGDLSGGKMDLDQAIKIHPRYVWSYISRGILSRKMNQNQEALKNFSLALKYLSLQDPIYNVVDRFHYGQILAARIHREIGVLYSEELKLDKALDSFHTAIQLNEEDLAAHLRRGNLYRKKKKWTEALEDYRKVLTLSKKEGRDVERIEKVIKAVEKRVQSQ